MSATRQGAPGVPAQQLTSPKGAMVPPTKK